MVEAPPESVLVIDCDGYHLVYPNDGTYDLPGAVEYIRTDCVKSLHPTGLEGLNEKEI